MSNLPDEVLLLTFSQLLPYSHEDSYLSDPHDHGDTADLARLCRVSHRFHRLAEPLLYQTIKFEQFAANPRRLSECDYEPRRGANGLIPLSGLEVLCCRPELGQHIREIGGSICSEFVDIEEVQYPGATRAFIQQAYPSSVTSFVEGLLECEQYNDLDAYSDKYRNRDLALVLLLCLSPRLETLSITLGGVDDSPLVQLLHFVRETIGETPTLATSTEASVPWTWPAPLWHLRKFQGYHDQEVDHGEFFKKESIAAARSLPQLKSFAMFSLEDQDDDPEESQVSPDDVLEPDSRPNLTHLELIGMPFTRCGSLRSIFSPFPNLESAMLLFATDEILEDDETQDGTFLDCGETIRSMHCCSKLRRFELNIDRDGCELEVAPGIIGSIRDRLVNLKQLRVSIARLAGASPDGPLSHPDLCSLLPASLECLWTSISFAQTTHERHGLENLFLQAPEWLPNLEWVWVDVPAPDYEWKFEPSGWQRTMHRAWYNVEGSETLAARCHLFRKKEAAVYRNGRTPPGWERFVEG